MLLRVLSAADRYRLPGEPGEVTGEEMTSRSFLFDFPYFERLKVSWLMR